MQLLGELLKCSAINLSHVALKYIELYFSYTVCKEPPYKVEESGYAGFLMPIEVYFKNKVSTSLSHIVFTTQSTLFHF